MKKCPKCGESVAMQAVLITLCVYAMLHPGSRLARGASGASAPKGPFIFSIVAGVTVICTCAWGLRLNARRRKIMGERDL